MAKVTVVFSSLFGANAQLADVVGSVLGDLRADVRLRAVRQLVLAEDEVAAARAEPDATADDLTWAQGLVFTSPSHTGLPSAAVKAFVDENHDAAVHGAFVNKTFTAMATSQFAHAGQERVVDDLNAVAAAWGCVLVPPSTANARINELDGNPYGLSFVLEHGRLADESVARTVLGAHLERFLSITDALIPLQAPLQGGGTGEEKGPQLAADALS